MQKSEGLAERYNESMWVQGPFGQSRIHDLIVHRNASTIRPSPVGERQLYSCPASF